MKALKQGWVALILTLLPLTATAQEHVEQAFQDFLKSKNISFKEKHSKSSNPETLQKEGQLDAYSFKAKRWNDKMLDGIKEAMNLDRDKAYKEVWGDDDDFLNETMSIYYNDKESVKIGFEFDKYLLICFADTENRGFRYAYAVEWSEIRKEGMLIKAYARIPDAKSNQKSNRFIFDTGFGDLKKYGMDRKSLNLDSIMSSLNTDSLFQLPESIIKDGAIINIRTNKEKHNTSSGWLSEFGIYKNLFMKHPKGSAATTYATIIYGLCKDCSCLNQEERDIAAEQIEKLEAMTDDEFVINLFNQCRTILKIGK